MKGNKNKPKSPRIVWRLDWTTFWSSGQHTFISLTADRNRMIDSEFVPHGSSKNQTKPNANKKKKKKRSKRIR